MYLNLKRKLFAGSRRKSVASHDLAATPAAGSAAAAVERLEERRLFAAGTTTLRIEAGNDSAYTDTAGTTWSADRGFAGGAASTEASAVANSIDDKLYYTRRWGNFTYSLPAADGDYTLRLLFADPLYTTAGRRTFHVSAEGRAVLTHFDIAASGGGRAAIARSFPVTIADGRLNLTFAKGAADDPTVSAIELRPAPSQAGSSPAAPTALTASLSAGPRINLKWNDASTNEAFFRIERAVNGGSFGHYTDVPQGATSFFDSAISAGSAYAYRVRAVNAAGTSGASNAASPTVTTSTSASISWADSRSAPVARVEAAGIQVGGKLYVWGGFMGVRYAVHGRFDVFDMGSQTWSTRRPAPAPETHAALATDGRYIFAAGGQYGGGIPGRPSKDVWRYDTRNDTWSSAALPDLPEARYGGAMGLVNGKLYFFGGNRPDRTTVAHDLWALDLAKPAAGWSSRRSLPAGLSGDHISAAVVNGRLYAVGGEHGHAATEDDDAPYIQHKLLMEYNPATNAWARKADLPQATSHAESGTLVINGKVVVLGGQLDDIKVTAAVRVYDPATNKWSALTALPERRKGGAAGYLDGKVFFTGGQRDGDFRVATSTWVGKLTGL